MSTDKLFNRHFFSFSSKSSPNHPQNPTRSNNLLPLSLSRLAFDEFFLLSQIVLPIPLSNLDSQFLDPPLKSFPGSEMRMSPNKS